MKIKEEHKELLKDLGLKEEDFSLFDNESVTYEYDGEKGIRIYDPYYTTSYNEYIGIDGWSSWSSEKDTFMRDILKGMNEDVLQGEAKSPRPDPEEIAEELSRKFGEKTNK